MSKNIEQELTDIIVILDRSSSIASNGLTEKNIEGFNAFLAEQKKEVGKARLSLALFDGAWAGASDNTAYELRYNMVDIQNVPELDKDTYKPKGMTALYDAIGITLQNFKESITKLPAAEKSDKVVVLIMTDGEENASNEFKKADIAEMIKKHEEDDKWGFVFIGANIDVMGEGRGMNVSMDNTIMYSSTASDTENVYKKLSKSVGRVRNMSSVGYAANIDNFAVTDDDEIND